MRLKDKITAKKQDKALFQQYVMLLHTIEIKHIMCKLRYKIYEIYPEKIKYC